MKLKKIMIVSLILLAILTIGAVSASSDMDILSQDSMDSDPVSSGNTTVDFGDVNINSNMTDIGDVNITETNADFRLATGPVDPNKGELGVALILQDENSKGNVDISTLIDDDWDEIYSDFAIDYNTYGQEYEMDDKRDEGEGIWYFLPGSLLNFDELDDGQLFRFTFEDDYGYFKESEFRLVKRHDGRINFETLDEFPYFDVNEVINLTPEGSNPVVAIFVVPCDDEGVVSFSGTLFVKLDDGDENIYEEVISPNTTVTEDDLIIEIRLDDLDGFEGIDDEACIEFGFWENDDPEEEGSISERYVFYDHRDDGYIGLKPHEPWDHNDFDVEFWGGNVADHAIALGVPMNQESFGNVSNFTISIDFWGDHIRTVWDIDDVSHDEFDNYVWTTTDLGIDDRMWDISGDVECGIAVYRMDEGDENVYQALGWITFSNSPYISCGELSYLVESEPAVTFSYFPPADDLFIISIKKDGVFFANRTFKMSEMEPVEDNLYYLFLEDLGIFEFGEYEVSVIFTNLPRTPIKVYTSTFNVVPFAIRTFSDFEQIIDPIFAISLPEDTEGNAIIKVDGKQIFNETLSDIGFHSFFRGPGYYINLNSLNITESGYHDVELTVNAIGFSRTIDKNIYVNVTPNTFEFSDALYIMDSIMDTYLGTPIQDEEIVLYLNGKKAAIGSINFEGISFDYEEGYADIYGCLLPGQYQGRLEVGGVTVVQDTFEVKDNSGGIEANISEINGEYYLDFKAPWPKCGEVEGYALLVYVDAYPGYMGFDKEPVISLGDDELEDILDGEKHSFPIGELGPEYHFILVDYLTDNEDIPFEDTDYFIRILEINKDKISTHIVASNVSSVYNQDIELDALLLDDDGAPIGGAEIVFNIKGTSYTVITDSNGRAELLLSGLAAGTYTVTVMYEGDDKYDSSTAVAQVVVKVDSRISAVYDDIAKELTVTLLNDATGAPLSGASVAVNVNGVQYTTKINSKGKGVVSLDDLALGTYDVTVSYSGGAKCNPSNTSLQIVTKYNSRISAVYNEATKALTVTLLNDANGAPLSGATVVVNVDGANYTAKINNKGKGVVYLTDLASGNHVANVSYNGGTKCNPSSTTVNIFVKFDSRISAVYDDIAKELTVILLNDATGAPLSGASVVVNVGGNSYTVKINSKGNGVVSLADLALGTYDVTVSFNGGAKSNPSNTSLQIATKYNSRISAVYNDATKALTVSLVNDATGAPLSGASVVVNVDGKSYTAKVNGAGKAVVYLAGLTSGTHVATVSYNGGTKCNPSSANVTVFVKFDSRISAVYDDIAKELTVTLLNDATGAPLSGASVVVNVNGVDYTVKINSKGNGVVSLADLAPGTYDVTVSFNGGAKSNPSNTSLQIATKYNSRISAVYNDATKALTVSLVNDATGAPLSGASVVVNVDGKSYTAKVNGAGKAVVYLTNLEPGTYNATVSYNGGTKCNPSNTILKIVC